MASLSEVTLELEDADYAIIKIQTKTNINIHVNVNVNINIDTNNEECYPHSRRHSDRNSNRYVIDV